MITKVERLDKDLLPKILAHMHLQDLEELLSQRELQ